MLALLITSALAYETDQLTDRSRALQDETVLANALLQPLFARALERTNRRTRCRGSDEEVRWTLSRALHRGTSGQRWVLSRGLFRAPGFSRYSSALQRSDADRFAFADREDIYGEMTIGRSLILAIGGPCATFSIGGQRIGSDKLDHFFDLGWTYARRVHRGDTEEEAVARGTKTERTVFGLMTSRVFSYADLRANWDGYRFYRGLLGADSVFGRGPDGCVRQVRDFDWSEWVHPEWDEVLNPSMYPPRVLERLQATLADRRAVVCAERAVWDADGARQRRMAALDRPVPWVVGEAPDRHDPFQLATLCADGPAPGEGAVP